MTDALDRYLRRHALTQRFGRGLASRIIDGFSRGDAEIISLVREFFDTAKIRDINALAAGRGSRVAEALRADILRVIDTQKASARALASRELLDYAQDQAAFTAKSIGLKISKTAVIDIADRAVKMPTVGKSTDDLVAEYLDRYGSQIISGVVTSAGDGSDAAAKITGSRDQNYADGLISQRDRNAETAAVTATNGVENHANILTHNADGERIEIFVATLDGRTTFQCASLDGNEYPVGDGPQPPLHVNCRSVRVPKSVYTGVRPFVADDRVVAKIPKDERKEKIGQVSAKVSYKEWFARQPADFQREWLGRERYELYKSGDYSIERFVDQRTGRRYTLDDLRGLSN